MTVPARPKSPQKLDNLTVAIRSHDMHHGLIRKQSGLINRFMKRTREVGAAAQLCSVIKDFEVIDDYGQLEVSAGEIGIDCPLLEKALRVLREVGFVRLREAGEEIRRVDITVPLLREVYSQLGDFWGASEPTDVERVSIQILDDLTLLPTKVREIQAAYGLNVGDLEVIRDIGQNAGYLATYISRKDSEEVMFSPLHWDEHPERLEVLTKQYKEADIVAALRKVRGHQGLPAEQVQDQVLHDAIRSGLLPTPSVESMRGRKCFLFTPGSNLQAYEKPILEKARAIIACVRYGEVYGTITQIRDPLLLLSVLRQRKFLRPHTEILRQYETLRNLGVGRIIPERGTSKYLFRLIDNQENLQAIDLAIQLLQVGQASPGGREIQQAKQLLLPGSYVNATGTRATFTPVERAKYSQRTIERVNELIRGVSVDSD